MVKVNRMFIAEVKKKRMMDGTYKTASTRSFERLKKGT